MKRIRPARQIIFVFSLLLGGAPAGLLSAQPAQLKAAPSGEKPAAGQKSVAPSATTTSFSGLNLNRNILTIRLEKGFFEVVEMLDFENRGAATIVSNDGAPTLRFALPRSSNIRNPRARWSGAPVGLDPKFLTAAGDELRTSEPIPPGRKLVVLVYRLEDEYGGIRMEKPVLYDTPGFAVLPEKDRVQAAVPGFSAEPVVTFQDKEYNRFVGTARAGAVVRIDMQAPDSMGGLGVFYIVGGIVVATGLGLGLYARRRRSTALSSQVEREEVLRAIALLDDRFEAGDISSEEHARERASRFERLKELSA